MHEYTRAQNSSNCGSLQKIGTSVVLMLRISNCFCFQFVFVHLRHSFTLYPTMAQNLLYILADLELVQFSGFSFLRTETTMFIQLSTAIQTFHFCNKYLKGKKVKKEKDFGSWFLCFHSMFNLFNCFKPIVGQNIMDEGTIQSSALLSQWLSSPHQPTTHISTTSILFSNFECISWLYHSLDQSHCDVIFLRIIFKYTQQCISLTPTNLPV